jgi:BirA family transcriptional regulator, biotin operon repressor / biotin---[acetyl-CoA-carboxylase] ligase
MPTEEQVLSLLKMHTGYVSAKTLAKEVGVSRNVISKWIRILRKYGYNIESNHRVGYKIIAETAFPVPWELAKVLNTCFIGKDKKILYRVTVESTQKLAILLAKKKPSSEGTVIIAEQQTGGRGRENRKWLSPSGGIWLSVILRPTTSASKITLLPFIAAIAVGEAIRKTTHLNPKLRWPNDVMINGKKVAGILIDISMEGDKINYAIIGIGINANVDSLALSSVLESHTMATSISDELGYKISMLELTKATLEQLEYYYFQIRESFPRAIIKQWKNNSDILQHKVEVIGKHRTIKGIAEDINDDGSLLVRTHDGKKINVVASDVRVRF